MDQASNPNDKTTGTRLTPGETGHVLLLSMRRLANLVAYCIPYEFEDVIAQVTGADRVDVGNKAALELSRRAYKLVRMTSRSRQLARALAPSPSTVELRHEYELFFPVFNDPHELYALAAIPDWRARCRLAACFIIEVWTESLPRYLLEFLDQFDHVFVGMKHCVDKVARIVGRPCSYLPLAADVLRFCPESASSARFIDVCNIGRRSAITHQALLSEANVRKRFYYYDTFAGGIGKEQKQRTFRVADHREHRLLLAQLLQRSRYYITHRSRINEPEYTGQWEEISARFYEGAAAGAVMLGVAPTTDEFRNLFGWPDAVIHAPFDCPDIERVLCELDQNPRRLDLIRSRNVHHAALQHDWVYRLRTVFQTLGLPATSGMREREQRLAAVAKQFAAFSMEPIERSRGEVL